MKTFYLLFSLLCISIVTNAQNWNEISDSIFDTNQRIYSYKFTPDGSVWGCSSNEFAEVPNPTYYRSLDEGVNWGQGIIAQDTGVLGFDIAPIDSLTAFIAMWGPTYESSYLSQTIDGGQTWTTNSAFEGIPIYLHFFDADHGWVAGADSTMSLTFWLTNNGGNSWSTLGGENWTIPTGASLPDQTEIGFPAISYSLINSSYDIEDDIIVMNLQNGNFLISLDKGYNWETKATPFAALGRFATTVAIKNENSFLFGGDVTSTWDDATHYTYFTGDGGDTWTESSPSINTAVSEFIESSDSSFIICGQYIDSEGTQISHDNGKSWTTIDNTRILAANFYDDGKGVGAFGDLTQFGGFVEDGKVFEWQFEPLVLSLDLVDENLIDIMPNPATTFLRIELNDTFNENEIFFEINAINGQTVFHKKLLNSQNITLPISFLPKGIYTLHIFDDKKSVIKKFVKI